LTPSFNINTKSISPLHQLTVFAGRKGIAVVALNATTKSFDALYVCDYSGRYNATDFETAMQQFFNDNPWLQYEYSKTDIVWMDKEYVLTPQQFFNRDACKEMIELVHGDSEAAVIKTELILSHNMYNAYRVDGVIAKLITHKLPNAMHTHQAAAMQAIAVGKVDILYCHFFMSSVTVMLRKDNALQCLQTFAYHTPNDAAYYLLHVCERFGVKPADTIITACGMIDTSSALYTEVYKYFSDIQLYEGVTDYNYAGGISEYPLHYFSHLFEIAACV
jgi:hypothetical protein